MCGEHSMLWHVFAEVLCAPQVYTNTNTFELEQLTGAIEVAVYTYIGTCNTL